jgi:hypothetical protein
MFPTRRIAVLVPFFVLVFAGTILFPGESPEEFEVSPEAKAALGDEGIAILKKAVRTEAFRINPSMLTKKEIEDHVPSVGFYAIIGKGTVNRKFTAKIRTALFDASSYNGREAKCFDPGVGFRIGRGREAVEVFLCFHCNNLAVAVRNAEENRYSRSSSAGFGESRELWIRLAKEAFPEDGEIQALTPEAQ